MRGDPDMAMVRAVEAAYDAAWRAGDLDSLCDCFAKDAVMVNPRGAVVSGIENIRKELATVLTGPARDSIHKSTLTRIAFVTDNVAIVDGEASVEHPDAGETGRRSFRHAFTDILVRQESRWVIAHVRAYSPLTPSWDTSD